MDDEVWAVGETDNDEDEEGGTRHYAPGVLGPSDFAQDEELYSEESGLNGDVLGVSGLSDFAQDEELFNAEESEPAEDGLVFWPPSPADEPDDDQEAEGTQLPQPSGEENLPASCPTAQAMSVSPDKLQAAPAPEPSRPTGPPLKPAGGTVNKKRAPNRTSAVARPGVGKARPFRCSYEGCTYAAAKRRYLLEHERVHSGERPYKCTWPGCSYAASGQGHISRHKRTHTGDRPYPCKYPGCTYQASQSGHLRTHMRTHTGERPFRCPINGCDYAAGRKGHLDRHMRVHTHPRLGSRAAGGGDTGTTVL